MRHRRFGKLDFQVSALGFGCMRLPTLGDPAKIDEPEAIRMIRQAVDNGVNYFDSAYGYHGGNSERVLGKALLDGYRQKTKVATKMPVQLVREYADLDRILNEQLVKLQTDHIDFYLLHGLNRRGWNRVRNLGVTDWLEGAHRDGRIGHIGFSFHDVNSAIRQIIDEYDGWEFCQVQYNYLDQDYQAGTDGVQYAASKGLGVVVMEPLLGGKLANPPEQVKPLFERAPRKLTPAEWALQWLWNQPEVSLALSGMSTMSQLQENLESSERSGVNSLTKQDLAFVASVREAYRALDVIHCTECRYCMPCPNGLDIPLNFLLFNRAAGQKEYQQSRSRYQTTDRWLLANACIECRECEEKCPQQIPVADWMPIVHEVLGNGEDFDPTHAPSSD